MQIKLEIFEWELVKLENFCILDGSKKNLQYQKQTSVEYFSDHVCLFHPDRDNLSNSFLFISSLSLCLRNFSERIQGKNGIQFKWIMTHKK